MSLFDLHFTQYACSVVCVDINLALFLYHIRIDQELCYFWVIFDSLIFVLYFTFLGNDRNNLPQQKQLTSVVFINTSQKLHLL